MVYAGIDITTLKIKQVKKWERL